MPTTEGVSGHAQRNHAGDRYLQEIPNRLRGSRAPKEQATFNKKNMLGFAAYAHESFHFFEKCILGNVNVDVYISKCWWNCVPWRLWLFVRWGGGWRVATTKSSRSLWGRCGSSCSHPSRTTGSGLGPFLDHTFMYMYLYIFPSFYKSRPMLPYLTNTEVCPSTEWHLSIVVNNSGLRWPYKE